MQIRFTWPGLVLAAAAFAAMPAQAGDQPTAIQIPNDATNFVGDQFELMQPLVVDIPNFIEAKLSEQDKHRCAPTGTKLQAKATIKIPGSDKTYVSLTVERLKDKPETTKTCEGSAYKQVEIGQVVAIPFEDFVALPKLRKGLSYGALLVPFKYQVRGDKSFSGRSSVGGYLGYRMDLVPVALQFVGFLGATSISVTQTIDGKSQSQELAGISYGIGALGKIKGDFQVGVVIGADRVSKSAAYVNNGKPWIAFSLGFPFAN